MPDTGFDVEFKDVHKSYGQLEALRGVSLSIRRGELLTLLGPSGCGKTTLLRILAGFVRPTEGEVWLAGERIDGVPPAKRNVGLVFQNYSLFPHMTVFDNCAFGLQMRHLDRAAIRERVREVLELVHLAEYAGAYPSQLSGGMQQRIALARVIAIQPRALLLDEPFGAIDRRLRDEMQVEVKKLQQKLGITTLFVTHDQQEALIMSDRIVVMNEGLVEQEGMPLAIYDSPRTRFVAGFLGMENLLPVAGRASNGRARRRAHGGGCRADRAPSWRAAGRTGDPGVPCGMRQRGKERGRRCRRRGRRALPERLGRGDPGVHHQPGIPRGLRGEAAGRHGGLRRGAADGSLPRVHARGSADRDPERGPLRAAPGKRDSVMTGKRRPRPVADFKTVPTHSLVLILLPTIVIIAFFLASYGSFIVLSFREMVPGTSQATGTWSLASYRRFFRDTVYPYFMFQTLYRAAQVAVIGLVIAYPLAYCVARTASKALRQLMMSAMIIPLLVGGITIVYAWMVLLGNAGLVNMALKALGIVKTSVRFLYNWTGVVICLVYFVVPYAAFSLIGPIRNVPRTLEEAAVNMGASRLDGLPADRVPPDPARRRGGRLPDLLPGAQRLPVPHDARRRQGEDDVQHHLRDHLRHLRLPLRGNARHDPAGRLDRRGGHHDPAAARGAEDPQ